MVSENAGNRLEGNKTMRKRYEKYLIFVTDGKVTWMVTMLRRCARTCPARMVKAVKVAREPLRALCGHFFEVSLGFYWLSWSPFDDKADAAHAPT